MSRFRHAVATAVERFRAARFYDALNGLSDRQLADIGLTRGDVPQRARELARSR